MHCEIYYPASKSICELNEDELKQYESRLYPNNYSVVGFLGHHEKLLDVYTKDKAYLDSVNITATQIADRLDGLILNASKDFEIKKVLMTKGHQTCPFHDLHDEREEPPSGSVDWKITNLKTGDSFTFPVLITHLIRTHGFFEGPGSPYRVDPETAIRVLEIQPNVDYTVRYNLENYWSNSYSSSSSGDFEKLRPFALDIVENKSYIAGIFPINIIWGINYDCDYSGMSLLEVMEDYIRKEETENAQDEGRIKFRFLETGSGAIDVEEEIKRSMDRVKHLIESHKNRDLVQGLYLYLAIKNPSDVVDIPKFDFNTEISSRQKVVIYARQQRKVYN